MQIDIDNEKYSLTVMLLKQAELWFAEQIHRGRCAESTMYMYAGFHN